MTTETYIRLAQERSRGAWESARQGSPSGKPGNKDIPESLYIRFQKPLYKASKLKENHNEDTLRKKAGELAVLMGTILWESLPGGHELWSKLDYLLTDVAKKGFESEAYDDFTNFFGE